MSLDQFKNPKIAVTVIALFVYLVGVPTVLVGYPYLLGIITTASVLSFIAAGVWLTFYIGRINIGQGAFALFGGYVTAILIMRLDVSFWLAMPIAGIASAAIAILIGLPILRLRGMYFAMITLSLTETARLSAQSFSSITNGASGIIKIPLPQSVELFGITIIPSFANTNKHVAMFFLGAFLLVTGYACLYRIINSRLGRLFRSLQQSEELASSIGINVPMLRIIAFAISGLYGGIGGAFFVASQQSIYPATFQIQDSIYFMLYCFLGGLGYVFGPLVGTFVLFLSFEFLHGLNEYQPFLYAIIMISFMIWLPNGLLSVRLPRFDFQKRFGGGS